MPSTTAPWAWDKPGQDAIDRRRAFDYNTCAAVACLDSTAATEVVRRRCGMHEYTSLEDHDHG